MRTEAAGPGAPGPGGPWWTRGPLDLGAPGGPGGPWWARGPGYIAQRIPDRIRTGLTGLTCLWYQTAPSGRRRKQRIRRTRNLFAGNVSPSDGSGQVVFIYFSAPTRQELLQECFGPKTTCDETHRLKGPVRFCKRGRRFCFSSFLGRERFLLEGFFFQTSALCDITDPL